MEPSEFVNTQSFKSIIGLYDFLISPPIMLGFAWWLVKRYFGKQEAALTSLSNGMNEIKIKIALHESRSAALDDALKTASKMQEEITLLKSKVDAAFRIIDHLTSFEKDVQNRLKPSYKPPQAP